MTEFTYLFIFTETLSIDYKTYIHVERGKVGSYASLSNNVENVHLNVLTCRSVKLT